MVITTNSLARLVLVVTMNFGASVALASEEGDPVNEENTASSSESFTLREIQFLRDLIPSSNEDCGLNPNCENDGHPGSPNE